MWHGERDCRSQGWVMGSDLPWWFLFEWGHRQRLTEHLAHFYCEQKQWVQQRQQEISEYHERIEHEERERREWEEREAKELWLMIECKAQEAAAERESGAWSQNCPGGGGKISKSQKTWGYSGKKLLEEVEMICKLEEHMEKCKHILRITYKNYQSCDALSLRTIYPHIWKNKVLMQNALCVKIRMPPCSTMRSRLPLQWMWLPNSWHQWQQCLSFVHYAVVCWPALWRSSLWNRLASGMRSQKTLRTFFALFLLTIYIVDS